MHTQFSMRFWAYQVSPERRGWWVLHHRILNTWTSILHHTDIFAHLLVPWDWNGLARPYAQLHLHLRLPRQMLLPYIQGQVKEWSKSINYPHLCNVIYNYHFELITVPKRFKVFNHKFSFVLGADGTSNCKASFEKSTHYPHANISISAWN